MSHDHLPISDPTIICPNCKTPVRLTESLAAPLIDAARAQFETHAKQREKAVAEREAAVKSQQAELSQHRTGFDHQHRMPEIVPGKGRNAGPDWSSCGRTSLLR